MTWLSCSTMSSVKLALISRSVRRCSMLLVCSMSLLDTKLGRCDRPADGLTGLAGQDRGQSNAQVQARTSASTSNQGAIGAACLGRDGLKHLLIRGFVSNQQACRGDCFGLAEQIGRA